MGEYSCVLSSLTIFILGFLLFEEVKGKLHMPTEWVSFSLFSITSFYKIHYDSGTAVTSVIRDSNKTKADKVALGDSRVCVCVFIRGRQSWEEDKFWSCNWNKREIYCTPIINVHLHRFRYYYPKQNNSLKHSNHRLNN